MGKPFGNELELLDETIEWASGVDVESLSASVKKYHHPVYIVGSGGSFSACTYAADLLTARGVFAKAVTPLELFYARSTLRRSNLIFISASGRNTDILFAFKKAVESEPVSVISICMQKKTKLTALSSNYSACTTYEFELPTGKDGFLATNSLAAYFAILYRAIENPVLGKLPAKKPESFYTDFIKQTTTGTCFTILYGSYNHGVAVDLESKFSEAGLAPSLLSDYRHFAHGRHQWFDKREDSAIIALTSKSDEKLAHKTLALLPDKIPRIILHSDEPNHSAAIHLLVQSMQIIKHYGKKQGIDPGRPGVPDYGSKIYHLRYDRLISNRAETNMEVAINRKAKIEGAAILSDNSLKSWKGYYESFIETLSLAKFGSLVFDYDGTLCSSANRFKGMGEDVQQLLVNFVKKGFVLGIISGRGKSLREDLEKAFAKTPELKKNVIVGYYNGSDIAPLTNSKRPDKTSAMHPSLKIIQGKLAKIGIIGAESPNQLTFGSASTDEWSTLRDALLNEMMLLDLEDITVVESSHSIDVIPRKIASKNNMLAHCYKKSKQLGLAKEALCIGDKGQWPGNDYALLANKYSLSVGEVSSNPETGWNICPAGLRDEKAVAYLFEKIKFSKGYFSFQAK